MRSLAAVFVLLACAPQRTPTANVPPRWQQTVTPSRDLQTLRVSTCAPAGPTVLRVRDARVPYRLEGATREGDRVTSATACVTRTLDLEAFRATDDVVMVPHGAWLWPSVGVVPPALTTRFELPSGMASSVPWSSDGDTDPSAFLWEGYTLLGRFSQETLSLDGTTFSIARLDATARASLPLRAWLGGALATLRALDPDAPLARVQIILAPTHLDGDAVRFGLVSRGGGRSIVFVVDPEAPDAAWRADWQAPHEFVHLLQPVFLDGDAWLREGLATYYQEVLRARTGAITPREAWRNLRRGMRFGAARPGDRTLAIESEQMQRTHRYTRVYWWGAALALTMDVALRRDTGGRASLDTALRGMHRDAAAAPLRAWSAAEALRSLDEATGEHVCETLAAEALTRTSYPDFEATLTALGVGGGGDDVTLDEHASLASVRRSIEGPRVAIDR